MADSAANLGLICIRMALGLMLMAHGLNKIFGDGGIRGTARWFDSLGLRPGIAHAWVAAVTEIGAGALMVSGLIFPASCAGFVGLMIVAAFTDHRGNGFFVFKGGWEYVALVAAVAGGLALTGPGRWSIDHAAGLDLYGLRWGLAAVVAGGAAGAAMVVGFRSAATSGPA